MFICSIPTASQCNTPYLNYKISPLSFKNWLLEPHGLKMLFGQKKLYPCVLVNFQASSKSFNFWVAGGASSLIL
ncbi:hypothetical protein Hanom_Chr12g01132401 [Helianthus anomalus]